MIAAAVFFFQIDTGVNGVDVNPEGSFTRDAFFILEQEFSFGVVNPADIVIDGDVGSPEVQEAIGKLSASIQADPRFPLPPELQRLPRGQPGCTLRGDSRGAQQSPGHRRRERHPRRAYPGGFRRGSGGGAGGRPVGDLR